MEFLFLFTKSLFVQVLALHNAGLAYIVFSRYEFRHYSISLVFSTWKSFHRIYLGFKKEDDGLGRSRKNFSVIVPFFLLTAGITLEARVRAAILLAIVIASGSIRDRTYLVTKVYRVVSSHSHPRSVSNLIIL
jgi:hypothetical protein